MRDYLAVLTQEVWKLEQQVTAGRLGNAEEFLDEMFRVRHGLLAVRNMATLSREIYGRIAALEVSGAEARADQLTDIADQFQRIAAMADGQKDYLQGVIESYQTRTNTKMTVASERLAVIAAATWPRAAHALPRLFSGRTYRWPCATSSPACCHPTAHSGRCAQPRS